MKQKLSSRKFWSAMVGVVSGIGLIATGNTNEGTSIIISSILGYLLTEGYIDAKAATSAKEIMQQIQEYLNEREEE